MHRKQEILNYSYHRKKVKKKNIFEKKKLKCEQLPKTVYSTLLIRRRLVYAYHLQVEFVLLFYSIFASSSSQCHRLEKSKFFILIIVEKNLATYSFKRNCR